MKLENKIKKYINLIQSTNNVVNKQLYLHELNECKKQVIEIICEDKDFFKFYYNPYHQDYKQFAYDYIKAFFNLYSIKNIYCGLDKNFCTQIINIDFDI